MATKNKSVKFYCLYVMAAFYLLAGINHFWHPAFYTKMIEGFLPYPVLLVQISGVAEMLCGLGLLFPATRKIAAWAVIALLVAVFPANINMALHYQDWQMSAAGLYARLPVQLLLLWLAWIYTKN